jgi:hypothetical protein
MEAHSHAGRLMVSATELQLVEDAEEQNRLS